MADKLNAQQRLSLALGANIFEVETQRDRIDQLIQQLAERDATIATLITAAKPAES